jgi:hypothetical protein
MQPVVFLVDNFAFYKIYGGKEGVIINKKEEKIPFGLLVRIYY